MKIHPSFNSAKSPFRIALAQCALLLACGQSNSSNGAAGGGASSGVPSGGSGGIAMSMGGNAPAMGGSTSAAGGTAAAAGQASGGTAAFGGSPVATGGAGGVAGSTAGGGAAMGGAGGTAVGGTSAGGAMGGSGGLTMVSAGCNGKPLCWDFEEGAIPQGFTTWRNAGMGELLVDNSKPFGGSQYSLHAKDLQGGPQHTLKYVLPANFGPVMWGRLMLYTTPTRPDAHAGFFNARYPKPGQPDDAPEDQLNWYEVASYQQAYMSIFHPPWPPGFPEDVQVSDTQLVLDRWTCVEWEFDGKNDADPTQGALPRMWLDGTELAWPQHFTYSEPAGAPAPFRDKVGNFTVIELGIVTWQAVPTPTSWWIDDVQLGTTRIGCN
ncbi:MAG TPA: hypothetical protein VL137_07015 [Polyangiaceae bacterium]|nr:hypothetical protein [Polyangiaceae bacterium]